MISRERPDEPDPFLDWKLRTFFAGAVLLVGAVVLQVDALALVAAGVLAVGAAMMLIGRYRQCRRQDARIAEHEDT
ncbi:MAG TPA: hypothetical protein VE871_12915 [Longimicrobium sp.]|nr:hypothetical protein [Longimicrobium sp.]